MKNITLFLTLIIIFFLFNMGIYQKNQILKSNDIVLLQITPVDPRSILQGDYMAIRYLLADEIPKQKQAPTQKHGFLVITLAENGIGHFTRFYANETLAKNEKLIKYRYQPQNSFDYTILPNSFFFQEDLQPLYQNAKYAIFHYRGAKEYILTGLADQNGTEITQ